MSETAILRVGICACTSSYHGTLMNQEVVVSYRGQQKKFTLQEALIPEEEQRKALKESRCHFFLDVHDYQVSLFLNELLPNRKGISERLYIGRNRGINRRWIYKGWRSPPPADEILDAIGRLITILGEEKGTKWLLRMA